MKTRITLTVVVLVLAMAIAAKAQKKYLTKEKLNEYFTQEKSEEVPLDYKLKGFNLGLGIGAGFTLNRNLQVATISQLDQTLQFDKVSKVNLTLTTLFMVPLRGAQSVKRRMDKKRSLDATVYQYGEGDAKSKTYVVPYGPYLIANINYSDFTKAAETRPFNQSINGGIGFGWRFNDVAMVAITGEAITFKQPKDFLLTKAGQVLQGSDGKAITSIDTSDTNYFKDFTAFSLSIKLVYILSQSDE